MLDQHTEMGEGSSPSRENLGLHGVYESPELRIISPQTRFVIPALPFTNIDYDPTVYNEIKEKDEPNGYLVGVGVGDTLTLISAFSAEPKGVVIVDIDPEVILMAKVLVSGFQQYADWESFAKSVLFSPKIIEIARRQVAAEQDPRLKASMQLHMRRFDQDVRNMWYGLIFNSQWDDLPKELKEEFLKDNFIDRDRLLSYYPNIGEVPSAIAFPLDERAFQIRGFGPIATIAREYERFHALAQQDKIAIVFASVFDATFLDELTKLPNYKTSNNIVYLANALEYIEGVLKKSSPQAVVEASETRFPLLKMLEPQLPNKNAYVRMGQLDGSQGTGLVRAKNP